MMRSTFTCPQPHVRAMFRTMGSLAPAATEIALSGSSGPGRMGKTGKNLDIVNFMNFTSRRMVASRGRTAV
jgi:hypothetical protein